MTAPTLIPLGKSDTIQPGDYVQLPTKPKCPKCGSDAQRWAGTDFPYRCPRCGFGFTPENNPANPDVSITEKPLSETLKPSFMSPRAELTDKAEAWVKANFEEHTSEYYKTLGILVHFISDHFPK